MEQKLNDVLKDRGLGQFRSAHGEGPLTASGHVKVRSRSLEASQGFLPGVKVPSHRLTGDSRMKEVSTYCRGWLLEGGHRRGLWPRSRTYSVHLHRDNTIYKDRGIPVRSPVYQGPEISGRFMRREKMRRWESRPGKTLSLSRTIKPPQIDSLHV